MTMDTRRQKEKKAARRRTIFAGTASLAIHAVFFGILSILSTPTTAAIGVSAISVDLSSGAGGDSEIGGRDRSGPIATKPIRPERESRPSTKVSAEAPQAAPLGDQQIEGKESPGLADQAATSPGEEATRTESGEGAANGKGGLGEGGTGDAVNAGSVLGHADEAEALGARIAAEVEARKSYPEAARRRGTEGTVRLRLRVTADGKLTAARIEESSGSPLLDRAAVSLVSSIFPLDNPARRELEFFLSIRYSISAAGKL